MIRNWLDKLRARFGRTPQEQDASTPVVPVDDDLLPLLEELAKRQNTTIETMAAELLYEATLERRTSLDNLEQWQALTPRERETAALTCLGYTNQQIADQMVISPNTVKTHIRNIYAKFDVNSKTDLQQALAGWDFQKWLETRDGRPETRD